MTQEAVESSPTDFRSLDQVPHAPARHEPIGFLLRLAKALHAYGLPAYELERTINGCAGALGYGMQCMSLPTSVSMTFMPEDGEPQTFLIRVDPGQVHLEKLRKTTEVAQQVIAGNITTKQGAKKLKQISSAESEYPWWLMIMAYGLVSAGIARIFSGGMEEVVAASMIGVMVGSLALLSRSRPLLEHLLPSVCAFVATLSAIAIANYSGFKISVTVVAVSGLIILLPGLMLTIAMAELATQNLVSGTARLTGAATVFIQLAFGSALAVELGVLFGLDVKGAGVEAVPFDSVLVAVAVAAIGLVPTFEARKRDTLWFLIAALTAFVTVHFATQLLGAPLGAFCGAITIGVIANLFTRLFSIPGAMIMMPGFIILVPGSVGYRSIIALVDRDVLGGLQTAFDVAIIGIALVGGFLISSMLPLPQGKAADDYYSEKLD